MSDQIPAPDHDAPTTPPAAVAPTDHDRRAALAKLGALAAWTAPVMLTLAISARASVESLPGPP
ncbi:MAG: hypothetical protein IT487_19245 [Chromatiaceae bacterium]|nr:hypothetical protein [Chromatiaceae bacterium]